MMKHLCMVVALLAVSATAQAQGGRVAFELRDSAGRPVDGVLTLRAASGGQRYQCASTASRCSLQVPPGAYRAEVAPRRERAPAPRQVTVAAGRTLTLRMRTQAGAPANMVNVAVPRSATQVTVRPAVQPTAQPSTVRPPARINPNVRPANRVNVSAAMVAVRPQNPIPRTVQPASMVAVRPAAMVTTRPVATSAARVPSRPATNVAVRPAVRVHPGATAVSVRPGATATSGTAAVATPSRNLGQGRQACVMGRVVDGSGRPMDATLTFSQGGRQVGQVTSTAGRFTAFDLAPGRYDIQARSRRDGRTIRLNWTVTANSTLRPLVRIR